MKERGKFIVIYGANNLGKSTQVGLLGRTLSAMGKEVEVIKYPIYSLEPTGPRINDMLRGGSLELTPEELQREFAQNRRDFQPRLESLLNSGKWVVAEDYKGTGIVWGVTYGVSLEVMEEINAGLLDEDLAVLLDGERFSAGIERAHLHEQGGKWDLARKVHLELAERYGWVVIGASNQEHEVARRIWEVVESRLL